MGSFDKKKPRSNIETSVPLKLRQSPPPGPDRMPRSISPHRFQRPWDDDGLSRWRSPPPSGGWNVNLCSPTCWATPSSPAPCSSCRGGGGGGDSGGSLLTQQHRGNIKRGAKRAQAEGLQVGIRNGLHQFLYTLLFISYCLTLSPREHL
jgi:hypothetical protein